MEALVKNATTVASIYKAFEKGDVPFIISQLEKNVLWEVMGAKPNPIAGTYRGSANVPSFFLALANNYQLENFQVQYILDADENTVFAKGCHEGSGLTSGKPLKTHWAMEWKFNEEGKVSEFRNMYDTQAYSNAL